VNKLHDENNEKIDKDMSLIKITITDNHLKLLKYLRSVNKAGFIIGTEDEDEDQAPFVENNLYEAINLILNGIPENFDPLNTEDEYSTEKAEWDKLYSETKMSSVILQTQKFETGD
jgi:hypothetical protein